MVLGYVLSYGYVLLVLLAAFGAERLELLNREGRRKLVHVLLAFTWIIMAAYLKGTIHMAVIPASFVAVNLCVYLAAKKADGVSLPIFFNVERTGEAETPGTVYYAVSILLMCVLTLLSEQMLLPCGIGIFCLAFGDGMAGVFGKKAKGIFACRVTKSKSLGGSLACLIFSVAGCELLMLLTGESAAFPKILLIGAVCAVLELPDSGLDNLSVPLGCMLLANWIL